MPKLKKPMKKTKKTRKLTKKEGNDLTLLHTQPEKKTKAERGSLEWLASCRIETWGRTVPDHPDRTETVVKFIDALTKRVVKKLEFLSWTGQETDTFHSMIVSDQDYTYDINVIGYFDQIRERYKDVTNDKLSNLIQYYKATITLTLIMEVLGLSRKDAKDFISLSLQFDIFEHRNTGWIFRERRKRDLEKELTEGKREPQCSKCGRELTIEDRMEMTEINDNERRSLARKQEEIEEIEEEDDPLPKRQRRKRT